MPAVKTKSAFLLLVTLLLTLTIVEIVLRGLGGRPGVYTLSRDFKVVDSPFVYNNYVNDDFGIYKYSKWVGDSIYNRLLMHMHQKEAKPLLNDILDIDNLGLLLNDHLKVLDSSYRSSLLSNLNMKGFESPIKSDLQKEYFTLTTKKNRSKREEYIVDYMNRPLNEEGFRSISFEDVDSTEKKIFIVGDSYVFGMYARPFHASFTDNLLANGYMVYAAGIPGTDPAQYASIARKYIPIIKPDLVVMCFYEGNDYMLYDREPHPDRPIEYISNAGFFQSAPYGQFMDFNTCYNYYKTLVSIPDTESNAFNKLMSKTVLSSLLWGGLHKMGLVKHDAVTASEKKLRLMYENQNPEFTARHIRAFNETCKQNSVPALYTIIPQRDDVLKSGSEFAIPDTAKAKTVFVDLPFHYSKTLNRNIHYHQKRDTHFNTDGHICFAVFLDTLISKFSVGYTTKGRQ